MKIKDDIILKQVEPSVFVGFGLLKVSQLCLYNILKLFT